MFVFYFLFVFSLSEGNEEELTAEDYEYMSEEYGYDLVYEDYDMDEQDLSDNEFFAHYHPEFDAEQRKLYGYDNDNPDDLINKELEHVEKELDNKLNKNEESDDETTPETLKSNLHGRLIDDHLKRIEQRLGNQKIKDTESNNKIQDEIEKRRAILAQHEKEMAEMLAQKKKYRLENPPLPLSLDPKQGYVSHSFQIIAHLGNFNNDGCKCRFNETIIVQGYEFEGDGCSCMVPVYKKPGIVLVEVAEYDELNWIKMGTIKIVKKPIIKHTLIIILIAVVLLYAYVTIRQRLTTVRRRRRRSDDGYNPLSNQYY